MFTKDVILSGDCLNVLPTLPERCAQFVLTDPPYLVNYRSRDGRSIPNDVHSDWLVPAFAELFRVLDNDAFCVSFYGWAKADVFLMAFRRAGFRVVGHLMFAKGYASSVRYVRYQHEGAYLMMKGQPKAPQRPISDVVEFKYTGNRLHPTQKPVSALCPLIESFSQPQGLVLDPFCGSGSTLVAANKMGRHYLGIEMDETYYQLAHRRLDRYRAMRQI